MTRPLRRGLACAAAIALTILMGTATPSVAAATDPDLVLDLPAGLACAFELRVEIWNNPHRVTREFRDQDGNLVRLLTAGKSNTLAFTNLATGEKLTLKPFGSVEHITLNADGSQAWAVTGNNVVIFTPLDVPPGPSTTLYVGRLAFTVDTNGVFTLQSFDGTSTDICAALSP